jgi:hypothetical protein
MAFLFFLLATVVATVNELIQTILNARARKLTQGLKALLRSDDAADAFFKEWRIERLEQPAGRLRAWAAKKPRLHVAAARRPSYIPSRAFALTVLETATGDTKSGKDLLEEAKKTIETIGIPSVEHAAGDTARRAELTLNATRAEVERAFDEVMDRASGWYKRYVQWWLLGLGIAFAIGLNVNSFTVAERLWKDDALRASVVQQAQTAVGDTSAQEPKSATPQAVAEQVDKIEQLKLPIGWDAANTKGNFLAWLAGWLVTAAAITLGAPFWFDVLGKLARVRGTGNREGTAKDNDRAPEDRDDPSRRR